jgi:hypothetical protein
MLAVKLQECGNAENSQGTKAGVPDTSELGNYQRIWRNVTLDSKPFTYLGNWTIPDQGVLSFDYVSLLPVDASRVEALGMKVMEDSVCYRLKRELVEQLNISTSKDVLGWLYVSLCQQKLQVTCQQALFLASALPPVLHAAQLEQSTLQTSKHGSENNESPSESRSRSQTSLELLTESSTTAAETTEELAPCALSAFTRVDILHVCHRCYRSLTLAL